MRMVGPTGPTPLTEPPCAPTAPAGLGARHGTPGQEPLNPTEHDPGFDLIGSAEEYRPPEQHAGGRFGVIGAHILAARMPAPTAVRAHDEPAPVDFDRDPMPRERHVKPPIAISREHELTTRWPEPGAPQLEQQRLLPPIYPVPGKTNCERRAIARRLASAAVSF